MLLLLVPAGALLLFKIVDILAQVYVPEVVSQFNFEVLVVVESGKDIACLAEHDKVYYSYQFKRAYSR